MQFILVDMIIIYHISNPFTPNHTTYYTYSPLPVKQNSKIKKYETYNRGKGSFDKPNLKDTLTLIWVVPSNWSQSIFEWTNLCFDRIKVRLETPRKVRTLNKGGMEGW